MGNARTSEEIHVPSTVFFASGHDMASGGLSGSWSSPGLLEHLATLQAKHTRRACSLFYVEIVFEFQGISREIPQKCFGNYALKLASENVRVQFSAQKHSGETSRESISL